MKYLIGCEELTLQEYLSQFQKRKDKNLVNILIDHSSVVLNNYIDYEKDGILDRVLENLNKYSEIEGQEEFQFVPAFGKSNFNINKNNTKLKGFILTAPGIGYVYLYPKYYISLTTQKLGVTYYLSSFKHEFDGKILNPIKLISHEWVENTSSEEISYPIKTFICKNCNMSGQYFKDLNKEDKKHRRAIIPNSWLNCDEYVIADILL